MGYLIAKPLDFHKYLASLYNEKLNIFFPKIQYTTDNAAMIAMVGYLKFKENEFSNLKLSSKARYKI